MKTKTVLASGLALAAWLCAAGPALADAEAHRLKVGDPLPRLALLQPGVQRYLRYTIKDGRRSALDIWTRRVGFVEREGRRALRITQQWDSPQPSTQTLELESWFEADSFRPLTHQRRLQRDGALTVGDYRFAPDLISGTRKVGDQAPQDYRASAAEPMFNFEVDIEFFRTLPWAEGYEVSIPFADPGRSEPARYRFKVAGSARIAGPGGMPVDCWLMTADYNSGQVKSRFWIAKGSQLLLKQESALDGGATLVKTLLLEEAGDAAG